MAALSKSSAEQVVAGSAYKHMVAARAELQCEAREAVVGAQNQAMSVHNEMPAQKLTRVPKVRERLSGESHAAGLRTEEFVERLCQAQPASISMSRIFAIAIAVCASASLKGAR